MRKKTFDTKGLLYVGELALQNCRDLLTILEWNEKHGIRFFRISSDLFPWMTEYKFKNLPQFDDIKEILNAIGKYAKGKKHRLTFHPGPFNKLASMSLDTSRNTIKEINKHSEIFDLMGFEPSVYNKINIHVGGTYRDFQATSLRFCCNFSNLSENARRRLTVENDDLKSQYSTSMLYDLIYKKIGIPIVHDIHHHTFCDGGISQEQALKLAVSTWSDIKPVIHYSESRRTEQKNKKVKANAHSDFVSGPIKVYGHDVDIMIEAKKKEQALLALREIKNEALP